MENLCKCNNCGTILFDENPQINAKKHDTKLINPSNMILIKNDNDQFWACPKCNTDNFLIDF